MFKLTDLQKQKIKKYSTYGVCIIVFILIVILLMKCNGCSGKTTYFNDGHIYNSDGGFFYFDENGKLVYAEEGSGL